MDYHASLNRLRGHSLIETMVAASVLMIGLGAAASLSLTLVSQEEIAERTSRSANYLENAVALARLGVPYDQIETLLPEEPTVDSLIFTPRTESVAGLGSIDVVDITMQYKSTDTQNAIAALTERWTGGEKDLVRSHPITVFAQP
ncbi:MAG: prepilin-type N-terminal cleavage/methylation domain-containing protein [Verrucomicrobiota bacterium]